MEIITDIQPVRNIRVRRRKYGDRTSLVNYNRFYLLDTIADKVWIYIDGKRTLAQIAEKLSRETELNLGEALSAVLAFYIHFAENGLIEGNELKTDEK